MTILYLIFGILGFYYSFKLLYSIGCMLFLPPGHPANVRFRRENWQERNPGKKHPFKY